MLKQEGVMEMPTTHDWLPTMVDSCNYTRLMWKIQRDSCVKIQWDSVANKMLCNGGVRLACSHDFYKDCMDCRGASVFCTCPLGLVASTNNFMDSCPIEWNYNEYYTLGEWLVDCCVNETGNNLFFSLHDISKHHNNPPHYQDKVGRISTWVAA